MSTRIWNLFSPKPVVLLPLRMEISYRNENKTAKIRWYPDDCHLYMDEKEMASSDSSMDFALGEGFKLHTFPERIYLYTVSADGYMRRLKKCNKLNPDLRFKLPQLTPDVDNNQPADPSVQWLTDFVDAEKNGMGATIEGLRFKRLKKAEWLIAMGVRKNSGMILHDLLAYFRKTDALRILRPGEPTNNSEDELVEPLPDEIDELDVEDVNDADEPIAPAKQPGLKTNADLLKEYLKTDEFDADPNAGQIDHSPLGFVNTLMETACFKNLEPNAIINKLNFPKLFQNMADKRRIKKAKSVYRDHLNPSGHLPAIRIGDNPYGIVLTYRKGMFGEAPFYEKYKNELKKLSRSHNRTLHTYRKDSLADRMNAVLRQRPGSNRIDIKEGEVKDVLRTDQMENVQHKIIRDVLDNVGIILFEDLKNTLLDVKNSLERNKSFLGVNTYFEKIFRYYLLNMKAWDEADYTVFFNNMVILEDKYNEIEKIKVEMMKLCDESGTTVRQILDKFDEIDNVTKSLRLSDTLRSFFASQMDASPFIDLSEDLFKDFWTKVEDMKKQVYDLLYSTKSSLDGETKAELQNSKTIKELLELHPPAGVKLTDEEELIEKENLLKKNGSALSTVKALISLGTIADNLRMICTDVFSFTQKPPQSSVYCPIVRSMLKDVKEPDTTLLGYTSIFVKAAVQQTQAVLVDEVKKEGEGETEKIIDHFINYKKAIDDFKVLTKDVKIVRAAVERLLYQQVHWDRHIICNFLELSALNTITDAKLIASMTDAAELAEKMVGENKQVSIELFQSKIYDLIDAFSYRMDAWFTAYADKLLKKRNKHQLAERSMGVFGWLEKPVTDTPKAVGQQMNEYFQAPSIDQAKTVAVLRAASLAEEEAYQINLSAKRVQLANWYGEGLACGYSESELLGYFIEREINDDPDNNGILKIYIPPLRKKYPMESKSITVDDPKYTLKLIDGKKFADEADFNAVLSIGDFNDLSFPSGNKNIRGICNDKIKKIAEKAALIRDAFADLAFAETTYQHIRGNRARENAWLQVAKGELLPMPAEFTESFRTGTRLFQKVIIPIGRAPETAGLYMDDGQANPRNVVDIHISSFCRNVFEQFRYASFGLKVSPSFDQLFPLTGTDDGREVNARGLFPGIIDIAETGLDVIDLALGGKNELESALKMVILKHARSMTSDEAILEKLLQLLNSLSLYDDIYEPSIDGMDSQVEKIRTLLMMAPPVTMDLFEQTSGSLSEQVSGQMKQARRLKAICEKLVKQAYMSIDKLNGVTLAGMVDQCSIYDFHYVGVPNMLELAAMEGFDLRAMLTVRNAYLTEIEDLLNGNIKLYNYEKVTIAKVTGLFGTPKVEFDDREPFGEPEEGATIEDKAISIALERMILKLEHIIQNFSGKNWMIAPLPELDGITMKQAAVNSDAQLKQVAKVRKPLEILFQLPFEHDLAFSEGAPDELFDFRHAASPDEEDADKTDDNRPEICYHIVRTGDESGFVYGLLVDEWTENITGPTETSALLVNYDAPQSEPPNCLIMAVPNVMQWWWDNRKVAKSIRNVIDAMKIRSITTDEVEIASFAHLFPPFTHSFTHSDGIAKSAAGSEPESIDCKPAVTQETGSGLASYDTEFNIKQ